MEEDKKEETQVVKVEEVCEELGVPEAKKEEGEALPEVVETGKSDFTMVNVSRDTHSRLKLVKAKTNAKSFDDAIRKSFGW